MMFAAMATAAVGTSASVAARLSVEAAATRITAYLVTDRSVIEGLMMADVIMTLPRMLNDEGW
jgi:hypothetical protein